MSITGITAPGAKSVGPYSHAAEANGFVFVSGQIPLDNATGKLVEGDISAQAEQVFKNIRNVLSAAKLEMSDVVKVQVFLTDMTNFQAVNAVYEKQFAPPYPARSAFGVAALPLGAEVEIELIAARPS